MSSEEAIEEYWIRLEDISSSSYPADGWNIIKKEPGTVLYVKRNSKIRFVWTSVAGGTLHTNYPDCFSDQLNPVVDCCYASHDHQYESCLTVEKAGNFQLQMVLDDGRTSNIGYFLVEPELSPDLPLNGIICETVLTKNLGQFSRWKSIFDQIYNMKYNMVHFTPVQVLGQSQSCYSIANHLKYTELLNDDNNSLSEEEKENRLDEFIKYYEKKGMYSICDVVWNHTAINTPWLKDHPDSSYNLKTSPHLRPAYTLDNALQSLNRRLIKQRATISTKEDIDNIIGNFERRNLPSLKLWEFFVINVPNEVEKFRNILEDKDNNNNTILENIEHEHHPFASDLTEECILLGDGTRGAKTVRMSCALQIFKNRKLSIDDKCTSFRRMLDRYNYNYYEQWNEDKKIIIESLKNHLKYERIDSNGPKFTKVTLETPLFPNYFTTLKYEPYICPISGIDDDDDNDFHELKIDGANNFACANAGWVFGMENTVDLTSSKTRIYLRRQLVAWTDSIKLRFGNEPKDSPFLWDYMKKYTCNIAKLFHGIRIDNCHSTPIHVAKHLLQEARSIRENLFVTAELFSSNENESNYVEKLGLTCLIRESMQCSTPENLSSKFYEYNGGSRKAVGSLFPSLISIAKNPYYSSDKQHIYLHCEKPRNLFMECTHDNEPPSIKRTASDSLPNSAIVSLTNSAIGSVLGYDQLVPHRIDVVTEKRLYPLESSSGIECCKIILNNLHVLLASKGYSEGHIHQEGSILLIVRHNPDNHKSVYVIVHTSFSTRGLQTTMFPSFPYSGEFVQELFVGLLRTDNIPFEKNEKIINGIIPSLYWPHQNPIDTSTKSMYRLVNNHVNLIKFPPGSIIGFSTKLPENVEFAKSKLFELQKELKDIIKKLSLVDLNKILYRCSVEEGMGTYYIRNWGDMKYCGIAGIILCFNSINDDNTVSHPICENLREGTWLLDYTLNRLEEFKELHLWMKKSNNALKEFYSFLIPKYFHWYITKLYYNCVQHSFDLMSSFIKNGDSFIKSLSMVSIQTYADIQSAPLRLREKAVGKSSPSLSAGLPHFASGYMRTWGRDTFISMRGLLLVTGRYNEALDMICGFASCLRHGMIPNLLSSGQNPRYNARDATWWFMQAIQDYCEFVYSNDIIKIIEFLKNTEIERYYTSDDHEEKREHKMANLGEIIKEIIKRHAYGISYREWNAGKQIDNHMTNEGFNVNEYLDYETGFLFGGNRSNCGTWMDKMGSNGIHGNLGIPSTPRDGADIEIIGLLASSLRWLLLLESNGFKFDILLIGKSEKTITLNEWYNQIKNNFEKRFWIPIKGDEDENYDININYISRRGVYKDTVGASDKENDYHFRPNQCIAMVVAPELFNKEHALIALDNITKHLLGKLGMKTLDPSHPRYSPNYDPTSTKDFYEADGFNYHQGPEWVWVLGYYLRARMQFENPNNLRQQIDEILKEHKEHIKKSEWAGLPELTNKGGNLCSASCPTQAWSAATILDALQVLSKLKED